MGITRENCGERRGKGADGRNPPFTDEILIRQMLALPLEIQTDFLDFEGIFPKEEDASQFVKVPLCAPAPYIFDFAVHAKKRWIGRKILDIFCSEFRAYSKDYYRWAITTGNITVNSSPTHEDHIILSTDKISHKTLFVEAPILKEHVTVLYDDGDIIVVHKPASMPCHPQGKYRKTTLTNIIKEFYLHDDTAYVHPVNRLDRGTSGIVLLARNTKAYNKYSGAINSKLTKKFYLARSVYDTSSLASALLEAPEGGDCAFEDHILQILNTPQLQELSLQQTHQLMNLKQPSDKKQRTTHETLEEKENSIESEKPEEETLAEIETAADIPNSRPTSHLKSKTHSWRQISASIVSDKHAEGQSLRVIVNGGTPFSKSSLKEDQKEASTKTQDQLAVTNIITNPSNGLLDPQVVLARPLTGRTHQIRAHLAYVGFPLSGDSTYRNLNQERSLEKENSSILKSTELQWTEGKAVLFVPGFKTEIKIYKGEKKETEVQKEIESSRMTNELSGFVSLTWKEDGLECAFNMKEVGELELGLFSMGYSFNFNDLETTCPQKRERYEGNCSFLSPRLPRWIFHRD